MTAMRLPAAPLPRCPTAGACAPAVGVSSMAAHGSTDDIIETAWSDTPAVAHATLAAAVAERCADARVEDARAEPVYVETGDLR
jgi:hypothetical protein